MTARLTGVPARLRLPLSAGYAADPIVVLPGQLRSALRQVVAAASPSSPAFRHGVRLAVVIPLATELARLLPLQRGYWLAVTTVIVLKPDFTATVSRGHRQDGRHRRRPHRGRGDRHDHPSGRRRADRPGHGLLLARVHRLRRQLRELRGLPHRPGDLAGLGRPAERDQPGDQPGHRHADRRADRDRRLPGLADLGGQDAAGRDRRPVRRGRPVPARGAGGLPGAEGLRPGRAGPAGGGHQTRPVDGHRLAGARPRRAGQDQAGCRRLHQRAGRRAADRGGHPLAGQPPERRQGPGRGTRPRR